MLKFYLTARVYYWAFRVARARMRLDAYQCREQNALGE